MATTLQQFKDMVNGITDDTMLDAAEEVLRDLLEIQNMRERIAQLEESITEGKKGAFYFFAMCLDGQEQFDMATSTVIGRKRVLKEKIEKAALAKKVVDDKAARELAALEEEGVQSDPQVGAEAHEEDK